MVKLDRTKQKDKKFDGDYTYKTNCGYYIITFFDGYWILEERTSKLSDTYIKGFKLLKDLKIYLTTI